MKAQAARVVVLNAVRGIQIPPKDDGRLIRPCGPAQFAPDREREPSKPIRQRLYVRRLPRARSSNWIQEFFEAAGVASATRLSAMPTHNVRRMRYSFRGQPRRRRGGFQGRGNIMTTFTRRQLVAAAAVGPAAALMPLQPAQAAAPATGKQNVGFYRYKVGDFEITVVTDGAGTSPLADSYVVNAPKTAVNAALESEFMVQDKVTHSYTPVVVNTGSKLVAIDTGLGLGMLAQSKGALGQYHGNLKAAGIDASAVDVVIISHFHGDHINGLIGVDNKPAFPNAELMVPEVEWAFWSDDNNQSKLPEVARPQMGNFKRVFGIIGEKFTKYQAGKELVPGITTIATPGHTPGHVSYTIVSGNQKLLVQSDVTAGAASLFARNPDWQFVFDTDKAQAVETRKKLYDMAAAERMPVQGFHFPFPALVHVEKSGSGYRLVPAAWNPVL
jgi:glyoxylase-like metal-dependent hydrolase (beta-lactamase superfamily II)